MRRPVVRAPLVGTLHRSICRGRVADGGLRNGEDVLLSLHMSAIVVRLDGAVQGRAFMLRADVREGETIRSYQRRYGIPSEICPGRTWSRLCLLALCGARRALRVTGWFVSPATEDDVLEVDCDRV